MTILVSGATGTVGRHIVSQLVERGESVRALSRDPQRANLPAGVDVVRGDLTDVEAFGRAVDGCSGVHFITFNGEFGETLTNGVELVAATQAAGVRRVSVLGGWDESTLEPALRDGGLDWALLAPVEFMSNAREWAPEIVSDRRVRTLADWPSAMVHEADIAAVAVEVLLGAPADGRTYYLTGPEALTPAERTTRIAEALGEQVTWIRLTEDEERDRLRAFGYDEGYVEFGVELAKNPPAIGQAVQDTVTRLTGRPGRTFAQWARENVELFRA
ncbi:NAD(P)H-binding protein [Microbacterium sp. MYb62]|uniref:NAD(P)H-binding protein n=1 Tax=Microbacterium sp. MYb62 TaxID=1848690 RepID=UPI000CFBD279|nr:NAD(P)H-binding protein [Microbacterium sp. MYb62]PRB14886.1 hydroxylase [Microbacterium sp. MYb62]